MKQYNYHEVVKKDVLDYIENEIDFNDYEDLEELGSYLNDVLFCTDSVTGNASGSYTFSTWQAEENLCHNLELLGEALEEFGCNGAYAIGCGAEFCDVTVRCYLLGGCISEALEEIEEDFRASKEGDADYE